MKTPIVDDVDQILHMASFLGEVGYRDLSKQSGQLRYAVCRRLWREGLSERLLRILYAYAESFADNPTRLFCWWLDRPSRTMDKIAEMRANSDWAKRVIHEVAREEVAREQPAPIYSIADRKKAT